MDKKSRKLKEIAKMINDSIGHAMLDNRCGLNHVINFLSKLAERLYWKIVKRFSTELVKLKSL